MDSATVLMWQGALAPSLELAIVELADDALSARGTAIRGAPEPCTVSYQLETAAGYVTSSLRVDAWGTDWSRSLELWRDARGQWRASPGGLLPQLDGALDCDLAYCCLTNTMPVLRNRLHGRSGSANLLVAWVSVPDLSVH
ncbi:MAG TPA: putative glycolipid-binding domain-containing protein, partial [Candidatus Dormibacteraeota bacterium]